MRLKKLILRKDLFLWKGLILLNTPEMSFLWSAAMMRFWPHISSHPQETTWNHQIISEPKNCGSILNTSLTGRNKSHHGLLLKQSSILYLYLVGYNFLKFELKELPKLLLYYLHRAVFHSNIWTTHCRKVFSSCLLINLLFHCNLYQLQLILLVYCISWWYCSPSWTFNDLFL